MARNNQHQNFGFGGRAQFRNESVPASPTGNVVAGPVPGLFVSGGDPLEALPPAAREKVADLKRRHEELALLYRASFAEEQATRIEIFKIEARIGNLEKPRAAGGGGLDATDIRVITEQKRLDQMRRDLSRLLAVQEPRTAESQRIGALLRNIEAAIAARPAGTVARMVEADPPPVKGDLTTAIEARRRRLRELESDLNRVRCAPWPSALAKQKMRAQIEALAETGRPDATGCIEHASAISFRSQTSQVQIFNATSPGTIGFTEQTDTLALFAWLHRDALINALSAELDAVADDAEALDPKARAEKEAEVLADILATERAECALIELAKSQNLSIAHRANVDPLALLQIEWGAAPVPAAREDEGQFGIVHHVGR